MCRLERRAFAEALRAASETFYALKGLLQRKGYATGVGDEGGFAPQLRSNEEAMELLDFAVTKAGYKIGHDIAINLDPAASEFFKDGQYVFGKSTIATFGRNGGALDGVVQEIPGDLFAGRRSGRG